MASVIRLMLRALACTLVALNCCDLIVKAEAAPQANFFGDWYSDECRRGLEAKFSSYMSVYGVEKELLKLSPNEWIAGDSVSFFLGLRDLSCTMDDLKGGKDLRWRYYRCQTDLRKERLIKGLQNYFDHYMSKRIESCGQALAPSLERVVATFTPDEITRLGKVTPRTEPWWSNIDVCKKLYESLTNLMPCTQFERMRHYNKFIHKWYIKMDHCIHIVQDSKPSASWC